MIAFGFEKLCTCDCFILTIFLDSVSDLKIFLDSVHRICCVPLAAIFLFFLVICIAKHEIYILLQI